MAEALERLAGSNVSSVQDPAAWQREQRLERKLPER